MNFKWLVGMIGMCSLRASGQGRVVADISNFESNKGICQACLFNSAASFSGEGGTPYRCVQLPVSGKKVQAIFENVAPGSYALFVLHDANRNGRMDKNMLGVPKEGYGASRNKLPFAAAPTYKENQFPVDNHTTIRLSIRLRNL